MLPWNGQPDRGTVDINPEECKGCGLCVEACPPKVLRLAGGAEPLRLPPGRVPGDRAAPAAASATSRVPSRAASRCCDGRRPEPWRQQLTKGNEAIVKAAVLAGCRAFYGYPITPASEIAEAAALYLPQAGGVFVQAESEVAAINMLYGGAAAGRARHDRLQRAGHQPDAGGLQLPGGRGAALRDRRHHARRTRPGQHRARAGRLLPGRQGRRPRQLSHPGAGAGLGAGDGRPDHAGLRPGRPLPQSGGGAGGRLHRADDGAGGVRGAAPGPGGAGVGGHRDRGHAAQPDQFDLPRARPDGAARPQAGGQVPRGRAAEARGKLERRTTPTSCWWATASSGRVLQAVVEMARAPRHPRGPAAAHHALSVPGVRAAPAGRRRHRRFAGGGDEHRPDGRRRPAGAGGSRPVEFYSRVGGNIPSAEEVLQFVEQRSGRLPGRPPRGDANGY